MYTIVSSSFSSKQVKGFEQNRMYLSQSVPDMVSVYLDYIWAIMNLATQDDHNNTQFTFVHKSVLFPLSHDQAKQHHAQIVVS